MKPFKAIFQNIVHYISEILPSFDSTYFKGHLLPAISPQAVGYHPIVQFRLLDTNETNSSKYLLTSKLLIKTKK